MKRTFIAGSVVRVGLVTVTVIAVGLGAWQLLRPGATTPSTVNELVTIECTAATGVDAGCGAWGDAILVEDAAPRTFEREDLRRLRIDRSAFGLSDCTVDYYLSRYPERAVWSAEVPCR